MATPATPTRLTATALTTKSIQLLWSSSGLNTSYYYLERSEDGGSNWSQINTLPVSRTAYDDVNLTHSTEYCYRVRGANATETSPYTSVACATTLSNGPDGADGTIQYNDGGAFGGDSRLTWSDGEEGVVSLGGSILFTDDAVPTSRNIEVGSQSETDVDGNALRISSGQGNGAGSGGLLRFSSGGAGTTGNGGGIEISSGAGGSTSGDGGGLSFQAGMGGLEGDGGWFEMNGGEASDGDGGSLYFGAGGGQGSGHSGGDISISAGGGGNDASGGDILLTAGVGDGVGTNGVIKLIDPVSGIGAIIDTGSLTTADKTFGLPDKDGTFAMLDDITSTPPGGTSGQLQFNDDGSFGGVPVVYAEGILYGLIVGEENNTFTFVGAVGESTDAAGCNFSLEGGAGNGAGAGGSFTLSGGSAGITGDGGACAIYSGPGGDTSGNGGGITIESGGAVLGYGGNISVTAGNSVSGNGGSISFRSGNGAGGAGAAGAVEFTGGNGSDGAPGGDIRFIPGLDTVGTSDGSIKMGDPRSAVYGILDFGGLTSTDKVFTFPDKDGTVAMLDDITGGAPGGSTGQLQFNDDGAFGGAAMVYDDGGQALYVGAEDGIFVISGTDATTTNSVGCGLDLLSGRGDGTGAGGSVSLAGGTGGSEGDGGDVTVLGGAGGVGGGQGGDINITAGSAQYYGNNSHGGNITITSGAATGDGDNGAINILGATAIEGNENGGDVTIGCGTGMGTGAGGELLMYGGGGGVGESDTGDGGSVLFAAGNGAIGGGNGGLLYASGGNATAGSGGGVEIYGGTSDGGDGNGGDIYLEAGAASGSGTNGDVSIYGGMASSGDVAGGRIFIYGGEGIGSGDGGTARVESGSGGETGNGAILYLKSGNSGSASGNGGNINISAGAANLAGTGGSVEIFSGGAGGGDSNSGNIALYIGAPAGAGSPGSFSINSHLAAVAQFSLSEISTSTTRVFTFPDKDGTFAMLDDVSPGGNSTNIQYNDEGDFNGSDNLIWDAGGAFLGITGDIHFADDAVCTDRVISVDAQEETDQNGNSLIIVGAEGNGDGSGGSVALSAGSASGSGAGRGGDVRVSGGGGGTTGDGGGFVMSGGSALEGAGGSVDVSGGASSNGNGGAIAFQGGLGTGEGNSAGYMAFYGGNGAEGANGGDIIFWPGMGNGAGVNGLIKMTDPSSYISAILDVSSLTSSDKTFAFPDKSGTFAMLDDVVPGGTDSQIQYNNGGAFGGMLIDYTEPSGTAIQLETEDQTATDTKGYDLTIVAGKGNGAANGGDLVLSAGDDGDGENVGGWVYISAGSGDTRGCISLDSSIITAPVDQGLLFSLQDATGAGPAITFSGAPGGTDSDGGSVTIGAGQGNGTGDGGNVNISPGTKGASGANGYVRIGDISDYARFAIDGELTLLGTARVHKELRIEAVATQVGSSSPTQALRQIGSTSTMLASVDKFSKTVQQDIYFAFHVPFDCDTTDYAHFHMIWLPGSGWTAGNYVWKLEYILKTETGVYNTTASTIIDEDVTPADATHFIETEFADNITLAADSILYCHLYRDVASDNGDDTGDVIMVELEYTANKLGEAT